MINRELPAKMNNEEGAKGRKRKGKKGEGAKEKQIFLLPAWRKRGVTGSLPAGILLYEVWQCICEIIRKEAVVYSA